MTEPHMDLTIESAFTTKLPKVELHAHLSGSVSKQTLHKIWQRKRSTGLCADLDDPILALSSMPNIFTFFAIFNSYIYKLLNDIDSIREATIAVIEDFRRDGVVYLELRTTPRAILQANIDRRTYVQTVLRALGDSQRAHPGIGQTIEANLILSIDRTMTADEAEDVRQLACEFAPGSRYHENQLQRMEWQGDLESRSIPLVLGLDLCGNPIKGDVAVFTPTFVKARDDGLRLSIHFAEVPESSSDVELETILSWQPDRLGHVIHTKPAIAERIQDQTVALELCLSCNMLAGMVKGEYQCHHFGRWLKTPNAVALSTDDVGVFESSLSNEYFLAAKHFSLSRNDLIGLSRRACSAAFAGQSRVMHLLDKFEKSQQ